MAFVSWSKSQIQVTDIAYPFPMFEIVYFKNIDNKEEGVEAMVLNQEKSEFEFLKFCLRVGRGKRVCELTSVGC